jgi:hypothetical protein
MLSYMDWIHTGNLSLETFSLNFMFKGKEEQMTIVTPRTRAAMAATAQVSTGTVVFFCG